MALVSYPHSVALSIGLVVVDLQICIFHQWR